MSEFEAFVTEANNAGIARIRFSKDSNPSIFEVIQIPVTVDGKEIVLPGEITKIEGETAIIQLYDGSDNLSVGSGVILTGNPAMCESAPGMPGVLMSGMGCCLNSLQGNYISRGIMHSPLDVLRAEYEPLVKEGEYLEPGQI